MKKNDFDFSGTGDNIGLVVDKRGRFVEVMFTDGNYCYEIEVGPSNPFQRDDLVDIDDMTPVCRGCESEMFFDSKNESHYCPKCD